MTGIAPPGFAELVGARAALRVPRGRTRPGSQVLAEASRRDGTPLRQVLPVDQDLHATWVDGRLSRGSLCLFQQDWPLLLAGSGRRRCLQKAAEAAVNSWMSVVWTNDEKKYKVEKSAEKLPDPDWSVATIDAAFDAAIGGRILSKVEDDIVQSILKKSSGRGRSRRRRRSRSRRSRRRRTRRKRRTGGERGGGPGVTQPGDLPHFAPWAAIVLPGAFL